MTPLYKFLAAVAAVLLLGSLGYCAIQRAVKTAVLSEIRRDSLKKNVASADSVRRIDTTHLHATVTDYETKRRTLVITDTVRVKAVLEAADSVVRACKIEVSSCDRALAARDSLIKELQKSPYVPRLRWSATALYDPLTQTALARAGPELRLFRGLTAVGEAELQQPLTQSLRGAIRVGIRKVF